MAPWRFVGRADELDRLVAAATGGPGCGLIVSGSAGVGKSRLLREALSSLDANRLAIWTAAANAATAALPLGGMAPVLPADQPPGLTPAGLLRWAVDALHERAAGRPIVLAIDDAHLLDPLSAALVALVARAERTTVLGTLRSGEPVPGPIRSLWTDDLADHLELAPLDADDTARLLAGMLGGPVDPTSAERLGRLSAGNPLLLRELVVAARDSGEIVAKYGVARWTGRLELAPSLTDLVDARIGQLDPAVRTVVELVAFGEPLGLPLLIRAADQAAVEAAEERGLIRVLVDDRRATVRLAHPLYGEVVRRQCPVSRTRRLLAELAAVVDEAGARRGTDLLRVAVWRLDSDSGQDPAQLLAAAALAFASYDVHLAARLARAAVAAGGGFDAAELLATILMFLDEPAEALEVLDGVADEVSTELRRSRWITIRALMTFWGLADGSTVDRVRTAARELRDPGHRAWVTAFEAIMRLHRLEAGEALRLARSVLDRTDSPAASQALARSMIAHLQAARGDLETSARTVAAVEAGAAQWRDETPYLQLAVELARGTQLILAADLRGVAAIAEAEFADLFDAGDFRIGSGYLCLLRGQAARLRGAPAEALRQTQQASAMLANSRIFAGLAHAERAYAAALAGRAEAAADALAESDRVHPPVMAILDPWREQARLWVAACAGRVHEAARLGRALAGRLRADGLAGHEMHALHDLVRLGVADERVVRRLEALTRTVQGPLVWLLARHARAAAAHDGPGLLAVADGFAAAELHLYAAEAASAAVAALRATRSPDLPAGTARLAALLPRCRGARTPGLLPAGAALTPREREVARLAAAGVPSRQIADQLYLSARTVDNHLLRVYAKLGIGGRSQLRAVPELSEGS